MGALARGLPVKLPTFSVGSIPLGLALSSSFMGFVRVFINQPAIESIWGSIYGNPPMNAVWLFEPGTGPAAFSCRIAEEGIS